MDGDTISITMELPMRIRIRDCWAPETNKGPEHSRVMGRKAAEYMRDMLPEGTRIIVDVPTEEAVGLQSVMSFGRVAADVYLEDGRDVSYLLCQDGHAYPTKSAMQVAIDSRKP